MTDPFNRQTATCRRCPKDSQGPGEPTAIERAHEIQPCALTNAVPE